MNKEQISEKDIKKVSGGAISKDMFNGPKWQTTVHAVCMKCGKQIPRAHYGDALIIPGGEVKCDECIKKEWKKKFSRYD